MKLAPVLATLLLLNIANAQIKAPEKIIGNWINVQNNDWEYGFFETFAIYKNSFWSYEKLVAKNNKICLTLKKDDQFESLCLQAGKDRSSLAITHAGGKPVSYRLQTTTNAPYTTPDNRPFINSGFRPDTVTIIGYYRNLDGYLTGAQNARQKGPFSVTVYEFIEDEYVKHYANFDSLGRFMIKFPVLNSQEVVIDYNRLSHIDVVQPGETIFLFADLADYAQNEDRKSICFMGAEARIHNELAAYTASTVSFSAHDPKNKKLPDLEFQKAARSVYDMRVHHLERYLDSHPTVSRRFVIFQRASEKYRLLFDLMQHRFEKIKRGDVVFDDGYMKMVTSMLDTSDETHFTLLSFYASVITDYIGYQHDVESFRRDGASRAHWRSGISVSDADVLRYLKNNRTFSKQDAETISQYVQIDEVVRSQGFAIEDTTKFTVVLSKVEEMTTRLGIKDSLSAWRAELLHKKKIERHINQVDSLFENVALRELLTARLATQIMNRERRSFSKDNLEQLKKRITIQPIRDYVVATNDYYDALQNAKLPYWASLKNTHHLKDAKYEEALFNELIAPYRGKVIYMDFWGTWCGPCRQQMPYVAELKKELENKDVIFMYLANNSPEKAWRNFIKEMNLTGPKVVHYRLPEEQQTMIERKFSVTSFPTYLLFNKEGNLALKNAPRPQERAALITAINKLL